MSQSVTIAGSWIARCVAVAIVFGALSLPSIAQSLVSEGLGATVVSGNRPYAFIRGFDDNLWIRWWTASAWAWNSPGTPSGVKIAQSVGATVVNNVSDPFLFFIGSDGNLWDRKYNGPSWAWNNHGRPSGVNIAKSVGVTVLNNDADPLVFVVGSDGNLWSRYWNGSSWLWGNQGQPSGAGIADTVGVAGFASGLHRALAVVIGTDGNLWDRDYTGSAWVWENLGQPPGVTIVKSVGFTVANNYNEPMICVLGSDRNLWARYWTGTAWVWSKLGQPPTASIAAPLGVTVVNNGVNIMAFLLGTDGYVWDCYWTGSAWAWSNLGQPNGVGIAGLVGIVVNDGATRPIIFVSGTDYNLWTLAYNGSSWNWQQHSNLPVQSTGLNLKYQILGVDYAPPGATSYVNYTGSTMRGTSTSNSQTFTNQLTVTAQNGLDPKDIGFAVGGSISFTQEWDSSSSITVATTTTSSDKVPGPASSKLGVDHDYDVIWVWLNPEAIIINSGSTSVQWAGYKWNPADPANEMDIVALYVNQLKNPSTITDPYTLRALARTWDTSGLGGLTAADFAAILAADPLASSASFNPNTDTGGRFDLQAGNTFVYEPPPAGGQPITQQFSVQAQTTSKTGQGGSYTYQSSFNVAYGTSPDNVKVSDTYTTTDKWSWELDTGSTNMALLSITGPAASDNYTGPTQFQVWRDNVYGSFMFYPVP